MKSNPAVRIMLRHRSVRKYKSDQPPEEVVQTIVRAGQQAPFSSQLYSVLLSRKKKAPFGAPLWFTICIDLYKLERFMRLRGWEVVTNDLTLLFFGIQDAAYMAENILFEDRYPELTDEQVAEAMKVMDDGYLAQDYYVKSKAKIRLESGRKETYTYRDYSWTEHISRKWGQWFRSPEELREQLRLRGFDLEAEQ